jgi:Tfp pilus assembly protein FimT
MQNAKGISLLELVTVIGILGVLSALAVPSVFAWRTSTLLLGNARMFAADLQKAKVNAIKFNSPVVILLCDKGYTVFIDDGSGGAKAGDWKQSGQEVLIGDRLFAEGIAFKHNFSANRLRFSGSGGNKTGTAIFIGKNGKQLKVVLSVLGRVRIE